MRWRWPFDNAIRIIEIFLISVIISMFLVLVVPNYSEITSRISWRVPWSTSIEHLVRIGTPLNDSPRSLIMRRNLLPISNKIKIFIGPYASTIVGLGSLVKYKGIIYVFIDMDFYQGLVEEERDALIGHEMGHVIYEKEDIISQVNADQFVAKYVRKEAVISLLDKLFPDKTDREYLQRIFVLQNYKSH